MSRLRMAQIHSTQWPNFWFGFKVHVSDCQPGPFSETAKNIKMILIVDSSHLFSSKGRQSGQTVTKITKNGPFLRMVHSWSFIWFSATFFDFLTWNFEQSFKTEFTSYVKKFEIKILKDVAGNWKKDQEWSIVDKNGPFLVLFSIFSYIFQYLNFKFFT